MRSRSAGIAPWILAVATVPAAAEVYEFSPDAGRLEPVHRSADSFPFPTAHGTEPSRRAGQSAAMMGARATLEPETAAAFTAAAARFDLSESLLQAVAWQESRFRPDAVSRAGAIGTMQLMPATAKELGVDPYDPVENILGGAAYLRIMLDRFGGQIDLALAAYNAGPARVERAEGVPAISETQAYVGSIFDHLADYPSALERETP